MRRFTARRLVAASAMLLSVAAAARSEAFPVMGATVVHETASGDLIQRVGEVIAPEAGVVALAFLPLGNGRDALGADTYVEALSDITGAYWAEAVGDNSLEPDSPGAGSAAASQSFQLIRTEATASINLLLEGGRLRLFDGGGGTDPLIAELGIDVTVDGSTQSNVILLSGRQNNFELFNSGDLPGDFVVRDMGREAIFTLERQTYPVDFSSVCVGCEFTLSAQVTARVRNPGGETQALAFLRDPIHFGEEGAAGAAALEFSGIAEVPEPASALLVVVGLAALGRATRVLRAPGD